MATPTPSSSPDRVEQWLLRQASARRPVAERVPELLEAVRRGAQRNRGESWDQANERHAEEFIAWLKQEFPGRVVEISRPRQAGEGGEPPDTERPVVIIERQRLKPMARRTTGCNYIFTVPGDRPQRLVLVAHYDTWRGPGADDNTTGEVITLQYLVDDLRAARRPRLTRSYILAGSEECGLIGFTSQVLLAIGLSLANMALARGIYVLTALGIALVPLAKFRFGVSGSREYVRSLSEEELRSIASVVSVDSVGEGRMYIPETSLGADFVRAFIPIPGYDALNDLLKEGAHLNGIKYNTFIAGGTTDHVSFLEVNSGLLDHLRNWLDAPRWFGRNRRGRLKVPAAALVALCDGKASPLVFGGKIHTANDTADKVYPGPLEEALRILDYWYYVMEGGPRLGEPRELEQYQYAQLYQVTYGGHERQHWLAMKDAIEPNRRNINGIYRVEVSCADGAAVCRDPEMVNWGVETSLRAEVLQNAGEARVERLSLDSLELQAAGATLRFRACDSAGCGLRAGARGLLGRLERFMGSNAFLTYFAAAYLLAKGVDVGMTTAFRELPAFQTWFFGWFFLTLPATVAAQLWVVLWLIGKKIPTMIDNNYRHLNKADNLVSLRRM